MPWIIKNCPSFVGLCMIVSWRTMGELKDEYNFNSLDPEMGRAVFRADTRQGPSS